MLYSEFIELSGFSIDMEVYSIVEQHYNNDTTTKTKKEWFKKYGLEQINKAYMSLLSEKNKKVYELSYKFDRLKKIFEIEENITLKVLKKLYNELIIYQNYEKDIDACADQSRKSVLMEGKYIQAKIIKHLLSAVYNIDSHNYIIINGVEEHIFDCIDDIIELTKDNIEEREKENRIDILIEP